MSEFGRLRGLYQHNQLNPVTGGMAKSMGVNIPYIEYPEKQPIKLKAAVSLYDEGWSIFGTQKVGRKRQLLQHLRSVVLPRLPQFHAAGVLNSWFYRHYLPQELAAVLLRTAVPGDRRTPTQVHCDTSPLLLNSESVSRYIYHLNILFHHLY